ncbi:site-specific integrase [Bacillus sp. FJAT-29790]|uniref:tyrosine-type recombinase/integrase n=1 Tax=Bacillus sp. FJAT-29790 TaxID=1895002 RepID=UPI001C22DE94|nr:site-specific integrase [Bacillus sp. FJAT-29790]MBU8879239.1 site-specific integrase [Bacillus sp. FJAT-29790]
MTKIELIDTRGSIRYLLAVNGVKLEVKWSKSFDLLKQYIQEWENALITKDVQYIRNLPEKYGETSGYVLYLLAENVFRDLFVDLVISCGLEFVARGKYFTGSAFCNYIHESDYLGFRSLKRMPLLIKAIDQFYENVITILKEVFQQRSSHQVYKIGKTLTFKRFMILAIGELPDEFRSYLSYCIESLAEEGEEISFHRLVKAAFLVRIEFASLDKEQQEFFLTIINNWRAKKVKKQEIINIGADSWAIPYMDVQTKRLMKFNFIGLNNPIKKEFQYYLLFWYEKGEDAKALFRRFSNIIRVCITLQKVCPSYKSVLQTTYIDALQIFDILQQEKKENGNRKYALTTIFLSFSSIRIYYDWLKSKENKENLRNPFRRFKYRNISGFVKNSEYIPDEVADKLSDVIHECPLHVYRTWLIMMNTGMRASEVLKLEEDCLTYNETEAIYYLRFVTYKILRRRRKMGLDEYHSVPLLSEEVVDVIKAQIKETEILRRKGNTSYIFIKYANSRRHDKDLLIAGHAGSTIANSINRCIKRHNIKDKSGELWHYSNHQCRKTLAVKLLTEGSSISEVGEILGHMSENTTRQYYQDVDAKKIAELDRELFEELFNSIDKDIQRSYTSSELEQLKKEILTGARETPEGHGSCVKHVSFGPCHKRSCVGCSLLLTGPQKLPMWKKLYSEQQSYVNDMILLMKQQRIENYEEYRDYQAESHLLSLYKETIVKIEKFIEKRIPKNAEKYS